MTLAVDDSENGTRISLTVSEIFNRKHIALTSYFFILSSLLLLLLLLLLKPYDGFLCSRSSEMEILDVGDYNISGTITTTESSFGTVGRVTLAVDVSENGTRISLTVSEIFDRKHIALTSYFFISSSLLLLLLLLSRTNSFVGFYCLYRRTSQHSQIPILTTIYL